MLASETLSRQKQKKRKNEKKKFISNKSIKIFIQKFLFFVLKITQKIKKIMTF